MPLILRLLKTISPLGQNGNNLNKVTSVLYILTRSLIFPSIFNPYSFAATGKLIYILKLQLRFQNIAINCYRLIKKIKYYNFYTLESKIELIHTREGT